MSSGPPSTKEIKFGPARVQRPVSFRDGNDATPNRLCLDGSIDENCIFFLTKKEFFFEPGNLKIDKRPI